MDIPRVIAQLRAIARRIGVVRQSIHELVWLTLTVLSTVPTVWLMWLLGHDEWQAQGLMRLLPLLSFAVTVFFLFSAGDAKMRRCDAKQKVEDVETEKLLPGFLAALKSKKH